ncbi:MAG: peptide ABC transporter ATP-binding protein [Sulfurimonas sp. RIFCSPLOWO2_12_FULL_36_74]|uniref:ATP-binding cassette domain-containing protein n=1 Tax=Sulfurimonas sp. RIFCSPLOWO2_12_36_12 TaxID=1802253 RepID=UPI0008CEE39D|nr:ATP-binding cassette domain-containing protein [Sulfurimonas sp. RIFCSPLOWO2_12_36_12]OHE01192.1 MAG: peptide ABC transporter ATP-binding protein [Sulfurimonas sp. RIFCSPLOWO2_12_36_12]OHE07107.1 MAG: peptide ABC transporter ATP-binding protein [Sulfurimonas sp. RIFCSPLOWO2_12_FULL_36_74]
MNSVLEVENLSYGYKKDKLLFENLSFSLKKGEIKAVVGASGAGKSTLFELILKNLKPRSGSIKSSFCSEVFQDPYSSFHPSYTLINQIKDVAKIDELELYLKTINLDYELLLKLPHELSGGQLQRASILRAMLMKPDLLLLDEPTSALDNVIQLEVMSMLVKHLDRMGMLLITHDLDLAKWCADEIIML